MCWPTSWSYYIPSISLIGRKLKEELSGNEKVYRWMDGRMDGGSYAEENNMIQPFFKWGIKSS